MIKEQDRRKWVAMVEAVRTTDPRTGQPKRWVIDKHARRCKHFSCDGHDGHKGKVRVVDGVTGEYESVCRVCEAKKMDHFSQFKMVIPCRSCGEPKDTTINVAMGGRRVDGTHVYFAERCAICEAEASAHRHYGEFIRISTKVKQMRAARAQAKVARGTSDGG